MSRMAPKRETVSVDGERPLPPPCWQPGQRVGDFVIDEVLGSGVTSTVYRVHDAVRKSCSLALKVLRLRSESALAASRLGYRRVKDVRHPLLVRVDGIHQLEGMWAISMEEVLGCPMNQVIRRLGGDRASAFRLATQVAMDVGDALRALHSAGLVHRDVKPDNLLVEPSGRVRLVDYGLVGSFDPEGDPDARRSYLAGTVWYMAPESIYFQMYPPACDVYALGTVLLETIVDASKLPEPKQGSSLAEAIGDIDRAIPEDTPEALRELICEMLDHEPVNRPLAHAVARYAQSVFARQRSEPDEPILTTRDQQLTAALASAEPWCRDVARFASGWLHVSGPSGSGKSRFAAELRRRLDSNPWFQVFITAFSDRRDARTRAFESLADSIARRFSRDDRQPLVLSERGATVLLRAFPSLRPVVRTSSGAELPRRTDQRAANRPPLPLGVIRRDAIQASVELVRRLQDYGPVFVILDDVQWADRTSLATLDHLLANINTGLGLITLSRRDLPPLKRRPCQSIRLQRPPGDAPADC